MIDGWYFSCPEMNAPHCFFKLQNFNTLVHLSLSVFGCSLTLPSNLKLLSKHTAQVILYIVKDTPSSVWNWAIVSVYLADTKWLAAGNASFIIFISDHYFASINSHLRNGNRRILWWGRFVHCCTYLLTHLYGTYFFLSIYFVNLTVLSYCITFDNRRKKLGYFAAGVLLWLMVSFGRKREITNLVKL